MRYIAMTLACALMSTGVFAEGSHLTLTTEDKPVPEEIDAETREKIAEKAFIIGNGSEVIFEIWFAKKIALPEKPADSEAALESIEMVDLLGAVMVHAEDHEDFREDVIDPGPYVMRMGLQPQDGNHMGTAPFDTFAVLVRADMDDLVLEFPDHEEMVDIALEPTASGHPPIFSLQPYQGENKAFPHLEVGPEEWQMLCVQLNGETADGESVPIDVQIVVEGIGYL